VRIRQREHLRWCKVLGRLTFFEARALRDPLQPLLGAEHKNMLAETDRAPIPGQLPAAANGANRGPGSRGAMKVADLTLVQEVLRVTRLSEVFPEFPTNRALGAAGPRVSERSRWFFSGRRPPALLCTN
jgi:hypothetical protein